MLLRLLLQLGLAGVTLSALTFSGFPDLTNNELGPLKVYVHDGVGKETLNSIKDRLRDMIEAVFDATDRRVKVPHVTLIVPEDWPGDGLKDDERLENSMISITPDNTSVFPLLTQVFGCGVPGDVIRVPQAFFNDTTKAQEYFRFPGKALAALLIRQIFGVFPEVAMPSSDPVQQTCSKDLPGQMNHSTTSGLYEFRPADASGGVPASLLSYPYVNGITSLCKESVDSSVSHNYESATLHNRLCQTDAWAVLKQHPYFKPPGSIEDCQLNFSMVTTAENTLVTTARATNDSGVIIGRGVDLGRTSHDWWLFSSAPRDVVQKVRPYAGLTGQAARDALGNTPLALSAPEAERLSREYFLVQAEEVAYHLLLKAKETGRSTMWTDLSRDQRTALVLLHHVGVTSAGLDWTGRGEWGQVWARVQQGYPGLAGVSLDAADPQRCQEVNRPVSDEELGDITFRIARRDVQQAIDPVTLLEGSTTKAIDVPFRVEKNTNKLVVHVPSNDINPDIAVAPDGNEYELPGLQDLLLGNVQAGEWKLRLRGERSRYRVTAYLSAASITSLDTDLSSRTLNLSVTPITPIIVAARVEHGTLPVKNVDITAYVTDPTARVIEVVLLDDGRDPDLVAGDGVYSSNIPLQNTTASGTYSVIVRARAEAGSQTGSRALEFRSVVTLKSDEPPSSNELAFIRTDDTGSFVVSGTFSTNRTLPPLPKDIRVSKVNPATKTVTIFFRTPAGSPMSYQVRLGNSTEQFRKALWTTQLVDSTDIIGSLTDLPPNTDQKVTIQVGDSGSREPRDIYVGVVSVNVGGLTTVAPPLKVTLQPSFIQTELGISITVIVIIAGAALIMLAVGLVRWRNRRTGKRELIQLNTPGYETPPQVRDIQDNLYVPILEPGTGPTSGEIVGVDNVRVDLNKEVEVSPRRPRDTRRAKTESRARMRENIRRTRSEERVHNRDTNVIHAFGDPASPPMDRESGRTDSGLGTLEGTWVYHRPGSPQRPWTVGRNMGARTYVETGQRVSSADDILNAGFRSSWHPSRVSTDINSNNTRLEPTPLSPGGRALDDYILSHEHSLSHEQNARDQPHDRSSRHRSKSSGDVRPRPVSLEPITRPGVSQDPVYINLSKPAPQEPPPELPPPRVPAPHPPKPSPPSPDEHPMIPRRDYMDDEGMTHNRHSVPDSSTYESVDSHYELPTFVSNPPPPPPTQESTLNHPHNGAPGPSLQEQLEKQRSNLQKVQDVAPNPDNSTDQPGPSKPASKSNAPDANPMLAELKKTLRKRTGETRNVIVLTPSQQSQPHTDGTDRRQRILDSEDAGEDDYADVPVPPNLILTPGTVAEPVQMRRFRQRDEEPSYFSINIESDLADRRQSIV